MIDKEGRDKFASYCDVSRETMERFDVYAELLLKWTPTINLISKSTVNEIWSRHFLDSAQVITHSKQSAGHWVDIGTGGGFPGMVVAILAAEKLPGFRFTFVESDQRKVAFLQSVSRNVGLSINIVAQRIEETDSLAADVLSARALAPLTTLLGYTERHINPDGQALLMKGASFRREVDEALEFWIFQSDEYPSITDGAAVILSLGDIKRV